jgi:hypothetical protein
MPRGTRAQNDFALISNTPATSDNPNRIATTQWVNNYVNGGFVLPDAEIFTGNASS